jgi:hypothetical protein
MSDDIQSGFGSAVVEVLEGIILSAVIGIIPKLPIVPSHYVVIFQLVEVLFFVGSILVVLAMESWGFWYLLGWLFGMWIMSSTGFVESWLFILYVLIGAVVLLVKIFKKLKL